MGDGKFLGLSGPNKLAGPDDGQTESVGCKKQQYRRGSRRIREEEDESSSSSWSGGVFFGRLSRHAGSAELAIPL